jgi:hypothetical protein
LKHVRSLQPSCPDPEMFSRCVSDFLRVCLARLATTLALLQESGQDMRNRGLGNMGDAGMERTARAFDILLT